MNKNTTVTLEELLISSLAQTDALSKLLIEKGVITQQEFLQKISMERVNDQGSGSTPLKRKIDPGKRINSPVIVVR